MRTFSAILTAMVLLVAVAYANEPPLRLTISTDRNVVKLYETVTVSVKLENTSREDVDLPDPYKYQDLCFNLRNHYDPAIIGYTQDMSPNVGGGRAGSFSWRASMVKPYVIHPGEAVEVQKTFTPVCSNCRVTLECQYQNSHTGYSIVYAEDQPPGPQSSAQSVKFKNPFVGTLKSNEIVLEVTNEIDAGITEKYKDLRLALLAPCCNAEGAKKAIEQWRMLECACFDDELWKLSFAEGIDLEVREGLWLYLVESLGSGRGYEGFDDLLLHAGILLTQDELKESATRLFVTLAESGTVTVKGHSLLWRCSKSMQKKAMDILDSLGVRYRTPDSKADSIQPGTAPAAATEPAAVSATPARELAPASSSMTEETPAPVVQQDDRCIYLFVVVGASAIIIAAFVVLKRKR